METGGGGYTCIELTDLENRLLHVLGGWIHIVGCPSLTNIELGLPAEIEIDELQDDAERTETGIEQQDAEREEENSDKISPPVSKTPIFRTALRQKQLQEAAELYACSTMEMAEAVKTMAAAISQLAEGLSEIAVALSNVSKTLRWGIKLVISEALLEHQGINNA
ncbi:unnamed protein product [Acanthoscelides obtectus]|uniref:Uncharacterized protein n=1 Tax=Acanthoscelides obtectus TaxID=200917 RepID=A0A9P0PXZ3_ACAOB|nr:unnamed protein product [Acanthoscelides obtectus]CAK1627140.1 hypothetical protein AOBTE_LOCUS4337 [Acanthoscelides obtectus]